jgi:hypothetical protein
MRHSCYSAAGTIRLMTDDLDARSGTRQSETFRPDEARRLPD